MGIHKFKVIVTVFILLSYMNPQVVRAQSSQPGYASWFDTLQSFAGTAEVKIDESGRMSSVYATFGVINNHSIENAQYFVQYKTNNGDYGVLLAKENFLATLGRNNSDWEVTKRVDNSEIKDLTEGLTRVDELLTSLLQQNNLLAMATQKGVETVAGNEAIHYKLEIPSLLAGTILAGLTGSSNLGDIKFSSIPLDFWLAKDKHYIMKLQGSFEIAEPEENHTVKGELNLQLNSIDNVQLHVPEYIRLKAMNLGIIEPDFAPEILIIEQAE